MENKKFLGCPYPVVEHPLGYLRTQWGVNQIKSDLLALLLTNPGERCMLPTFGTPLRELFFEPNDDLVAAQAREMIINSIQMWEPRVAITAIEVQSGVDEGETFSVVEEPRGAGMTGSNDFEYAISDLKQSNDHVLKIKINFVDPENITSVEELVLEVPMI